MVSNVFTIEIDANTETIKDLNNIINNLCLSLLAAYIFYIINDFLPRCRSKESDRTYIYNQLNKIKCILESEIRTIAFKFDLTTPYKLPEKETFIKYFLQKYKDSSFHTTDYPNLISYCHSDYIKIQAIIHELLRLYGSKLKYDEISKLEYLSLFYNIRVDIQAEHICFEDKIDYDYQPIKFVAYKIYNAYEVMRHKRFKQPYFPTEEKEELDFFNLHWKCNCPLKGRWCNGEIVDNSRPES